MHRIFVVVSTILFLSLSPTIAAFADTTDSNTGTLVYSGALTTAGEATDVTLNLDCVDGVCTVAVLVPTLVFHNGNAEATATGDINESGCTYTAVATRSIVLTAESIIGTSVVAGFVSTCDGQAQDVDGYTSTLNLTHESGAVCLIDASCDGAGGDASGQNVTDAEALAAAAGPFRPGERNDQPLPAGGNRDFAAPTELSQVATFADVVTPANIAWAAGGTAVLGILIVIPTAFANAAADTLIGRLRARWRARRGITEERPRFRTWPWAAGGVAAAAVIAAFADPHFGFDAAALRVLLSIAAAFALEVVVGWVAVILLVRATNPKASFSFTFAPLSLLVVAGAVLLTRLSGFEPAIVFGLVAGVVFAGMLTAAENARVALITLGWAYAIGMLAWVIYSLLDPTEAGLVAGRELLAAATISGISVLPIALLPLSGLPGAAVWAWRKWVWGIVYALALFTFLLVLLPLPAATSEIGVGLWTWVALFVAYSLAAIGVWLAVTRPWRAPSEAGAQRESTGANS
ncbi:MAG: hypothetical protein ABI435_01535 [Pseudolysinimonas sp.]